MRANSFREIVHARNGRVIWIILLTLEILALWKGIPGLSQWWGAEDQGALTPQVGVLKAHQASVQIQSPWDLLWREVRISEPLHESQSLLTGAGAKARVQLAPDVEVEIGENTLIQIRRRPKFSGGTPALALQVVRGSVKAKRLRGLESSRAEVQATPEILIETTRQVGVESIPVTEAVTEKETHMEKTPDAERTAEIVPLRKELPKNTAPEKISPKVQPKKVRPAKKLPPPPPQEFKPEFIRRQKKGAWLWNWLLPEAQASESDPYWTIKLRWGSVEGAKGYRIQISKTDEFRFLDEDQSVSKSEFLWKFSPGMEGRDGKSYYRIASLGEDGETGEFSAPREVVFPDEVIQKVQEYRSQWKWSGQASLFVSASNSAQFNSDSGFAAVRTQSIYLQNRFNTRADLSNDHAQWSAFLDFTANAFHAPSTTQTTVQPNVFAYTLELGILRGVFPKTVIPRRAELAYGLALARDYRWVKVGTQAVEPWGALSFGPALRLVRNYSWGEWETTFILPVTGVFTGGQVGILGRSGVEVYFRKPKWLSVRADLDSRFVVWGSPSGARLWSWSFAVAPTFSLGKP